MTKGIIFIGAAETGKSRAAEQIFKLHGSDAVYLDGRQFKPNSRFFFANCKPQTKVIIIDEIVSTKYLEFFMQFLPGKLTVDAPNQQPFQIEIKKLIIVCSSEIKKADLPNGASFTRRFEVVEFPQQSNQTPVASGLIKIPLRQLVKENAESVYDQFSHPAFQRKMEKGVILSDFSLAEKVVELEYPSGERFWFDFELFFGKVICNATEILLLHETGITEKLKIYGIQEVKIKRTHYLKLIFERNLPF